MVQPPLVRVQIWELPQELRRVQPLVLMQLWELPQELPKGLSESAWQVAASCRAASCRDASGNRVVVDTRADNPWQADPDNPSVAGGILVEDNPVEDSLVALDSPAAASCQAAADTRVDNPSSADPDNPLVAADSLAASDSPADSPSVATSFRTAADSRADILSVEAHPFAAG